MLFYFIFINIFLRSSLLINKQKNHLINTQKNTSLHQVVLIPFNLQVGILKLALYLN